VINDVGSRRKRNRQFTHLSAELRYALHVLGEEHGWESGSAQVRETVLLGLASLGWSSSRIKQEYLRYALACAESGKPDEFADLT
jgi:hypothetical protein